MVILLLVQWDLDTMAFFVAQTFLHTLLYTTSGSAKGVSSGNISASSALHQPHFHKGGSMIEPGAIGRGQGVPIIVLEPPCCTLRVARRAMSALAQPRRARSSLVARASLQISPWLVAAAKGDIAQAQLLPDRVDSKVLRTAVDNGRLKFIRWLASEVEQEILKNMLNAPDKEGNRPLHAAVAQRASIDIVRLLVELGAHPEAPNRAGLSARELAIQSGEDEIAFLLLAPGPLKMDIKATEAGYCEALNRAHGDGDRDVQVYALTRLGSLYLERGDHQMAAQLTNAALYLADTDADLARYLLHKLTLIEHRFLRGVGQSKSPMANVAKRRRDLQLARGLVEREIDESVRPIDQILHTYTGYVRKLLREIIQEGVRELGEPPCLFAVACLGSMARMEMARNSDLEVVFLTDESVDEGGYFDRLALLVRLKVTNVGETALEIVRGHPMPSAGFSFDTKVWPLGARRLIGTPKELAAMQEPVTQRENPVIANALLTSNFLTGECRLHDAYRAAISHKLNRGSIRKERVRELLRLGRQEFGPDFSIERRRLQAYGIKQELYRPLQQFVAALALYYGIDEMNTIDRIRVLQGRGLFTREGADNLILAVQHALSLRYEAHRYHKGESDIIVMEDAQQGEFLATPDHRQKIKEVYQRTIPVAEVIETVINKRRLPIGAFASSFLTEDFGLTAVKALTRKNYGLAARSCLLELTTNPDSVNGLAVYSQLCNTDEGLFEEGLNDVIDLWLYMVEKNESQALYKLALCAFVGCGMAIDYDRSFRYCERAIMQGSADAQAVHGLFYLYGKRVEKDPQTALEMFMGAKERGSDKADIYIGLYHLMRQEYDLAQPFFKGNDPQALFLHMFCQVERGDRSSNDAETVRAYRQAADLGNPRAQATIATHYYNGTGGYKRSYKQALAYFWKSARQGDMYGYNGLGMCYKLGHGVGQRPAQARFHFRQAAEQGLVAAQNNYAVCLRDGYGGEPDEVEALRFFRLAADKDEASAQHNLGKMYRDGKGGLEPNQLTACEWFAKAAAQGHVAAKRAMGRRTD